MLSSTRGFTGKEEIMESQESHEWQAQRIIGERQTPPGLEYEVSLEKTLWLPKATLDTKLVRRYRTEQRARRELGAHLWHDTAELPGRG
jgi:hypothetical protein